MRNGRSVGLSAIFFGKTLKLLLTFFSRLDFNIWRNNSYFWKNRNRGSYLSTLFIKSETDVECLTLEE